MKTRFSRFYNLPELMAAFREIADIKTPDMINLPVPQAEYHVVNCEPSDFQLEIVESLAQRAKDVRDRKVKPYVDNMLKITNDGRKLALDQRLINPLLPADKNGKVSVCARNVHRIWEETATMRSAQVIFCDLSTPKGDGSFNVYDAIKDELKELGIPEEEIAFIHDAKTKAQENAIFARVRSGEIRVLLGSTFKMGAGTNMQDKLIAIHDLDCPWRPADLEQRAGRIVRVHNENELVHIYRYVTEKTFDAYLYQIIENKQRFISQVMSGTYTGRSVEDVDEAVLSYAEIKALASGDPRIMEWSTLQAEVKKLELQESEYRTQHFDLEDRALKQYPREIADNERLIPLIQEDIRTMEAHPAKVGEDFCGIEVQGTVFGSRTDAGKAILSICSHMENSGPLRIGAFRGFSLGVRFNAFTQNYYAVIDGKTSREITLGDDPVGNITRISNEIDRLPEILEDCREKIKMRTADISAAKEELQRPFAKQEELTEKRCRFQELTVELGLDSKDEEQEMEIDADELDDDEYVGELVRTSDDRSR